MNPECIQKDKEIQIPIEELRRQARLMETKVAQLAANKASTEARCRQDITNKTTENSLLIHELDMLRVERKNLNRQVKDLLLRVRQAEFKIQTTPPPPAIEDEATPSSAQAVASSSSDPNLIPIQDIIGRPSGNGLP